MVYFTIPTATITIQQENTTHNIKARTMPKNDGQTKSKKGKICSPTGSQALAFMP